VVARPDVIDTNVRGRFSREISLPVPDAPARARILRLAAKGLTLSPNFQFNDKTIDYSGSNASATTIEIIHSEATTFKLENSESISSFSTPETVLNSFPAVASSEPSGNDLVTVTTAVERNATNLDAFDHIARLTPGFVGADLHALVREAGNQAICRLVSKAKQQQQQQYDQVFGEDRQFEGSCVEVVDFEAASKLVQPSAKVKTSLKSH